jgi:alkanesulfonate monooxygenase SsuD/methylene tetrahydromethanopterin reductase-like flavin-dependent oxidoreductase (luciferase family)
MALAIIGGMPERFAPLIQLYREAWTSYNHPTEKRKVGINSHAYIAETSRQAGDEFFPSYAEVMTRIGRERGWPPTTRQHFEEMRGPQGSLLVGSPEEVVDKILFEHSIFNNDRFLAQMDVGTLPHDKLMKSIELFGTKVAPEVKKALKRTAAAE